MESRHKKTQLLVAKWVCYTLLLLFCGVLQTVPGLFQVGNVKPVLILPLCLAVALHEGEFVGALFGMVGGLMWDYTAGIIVGLFAVSLLIVCFTASLVIQLYLRCSAFNYFLICMVANTIVLSSDFMFFYYMPGYQDPWYQYGNVVVPMAFYGAVIAIPLFFIVHAIATHICIQE